MEGIVISTGQSKHYRGFDALQAPLFPKEITMMVMKYYLSILRLLSVSLNE